VFGVLRALRKGRGGGWVYVGGMCASVTAMLQCDGHHSRVSAPCLEVQTPIRKGDRHCREGKERRHDTRTHGQERGGWCNTTCFTVRRSLFFSRPESGVICMTDGGFVRVVGDKGKGKKENRRQSN
jgi:hypothetical protein